MKWGGLVLCVFKVLWVLLLQPRQASAQTGAIAWRIAEDSDSSLLQTTSSAQPLTVQSFPKMKTLLWLWAGAPEVSLIIITLFSDFVHYNCFSQTQFQANVSWKRIWLLNQRAWSQQHPQPKLEQRPHTVLRPVSINTSQFVALMEQLMGTSVNFKWWDNS